MLFSSIKNGDIFFISRKFSTKTSFVVFFGSVLLVEMPPVSVQKMLYIFMEKQLNYIQFLYIKCNFVIRLCLGPLGMVQEKCPFSELCYKKEL